MYISNVLMQGIVNILKLQCSERSLLVQSGSLDPMTPSDTKMEPIVQFALLLQHIKIIAHSTRHFRLHILKYNVHVKTSKEKKKSKQSF